MVIVISRDQSGFYTSLKPAQERNGRDRVLLDRRLADRRRASRPRRVPDRRQQERRTPVSAAERALMGVLGFMVLQGGGGAARAQPASAPIRKGGRRALTAYSGRKPRPGSTLRRAAG